MNAVETKVVEMQFDNAQFEKNIRQSIDSLTDFKKSLNLEGAADSIKEIEKNVGNMDFSRMESALSHWRTGSRQWELLA